MKVQHSGTAAEWDGIIAEAAEQGTDGVYLTVASVPEPGTVITIEFADGTRDVVVQYAHDRFTAVVAAPPAAFPAFVPEGVTKGISVTFRATLTATTNEYLADRLPVDGYARIIEFDIYGRPTRTVFMPDAEPGKHTSFVSVPNAAFTFASRV